ncbi:MAG TPA: MFS transporter [Acidimicrobiales bacterium]|nr:MFS transporter [Acidimicrobiales bacterium]
MSQTVPTDATAERASTPPDRADPEPQTAWTVVEDVRRLRSAGRRVLGIDVDGSVPSMRAAIGEAVAGWYALIALSIFAALDEAMGFVISAIGPDISNSLGMSPSSFSLLATQRQTLVGLTALNFAYFFFKPPKRGKVPNRAFMAKQMAIQYGPNLCLGSVVTWSPAITGAVGSAGTGASVIYAAHRPMLMDMYPPRVRLRALSFHRGAAVVGAIGGLLLVTVLSGAAGLTWRGTLLVTGIIFTCVSLIGVRLKDSRFGRFDSDRLAALMHDEDDADPIREGDPSELTFWEALRKVWLIPSVRRLLAVWAVLGIALTPLVNYQGFWLQEQFNLTTGQRAAFLAGSWVLALPVLWIASRRGEQAWQHEPRRLIRITAVAMAGVAAGLILAIVPVLGVSLVGFSVVFAGEAVCVATLSLILMSLVRPRMRTIVASLSALFFGLVGGEGGTLLLGSIASQYSAAAAIGVLAAPALGAAWLLKRSAAALDCDLDRLVDEVLEDEAVHVLTRKGVKLPLLACQGIDFSYGQLQVLFDVEFTVWDGEILALLGVNGAGKSTLLKVISGIGIPSAGSIRFNGTDITYLDAERRVGMGITQIPGGRAVFPQMTVIENLRGLSFTLGKDKRRVEAALDDCFDKFPRLAERRNQPAVTLSGGEQQMLGLAKAFILKPQLLLIDELSLGLAPIVVDQLLSMVRDINAAGTAVVLVEQSVSVALSVVEHAYFMEKGEIRFDGSAGELLERDDLVRAVFLGAATRGGVTP